MSDIITKIEGSKVWGGVAVVSGLLAVAAVVYTVKTILDAKKALNNLKLAQANLDATKTVVEAANTGANVVTDNIGVKQNPIAEVPTSVQAPFFENNSDCDGCSAMSGFDNKKNPFATDLKTDYRF